MIFLRVVRERAAGQGCGQLSDATNVDQLCESWDGAPGPAPGPEGISWRKGLQEDPVHRSGAAEISQRSERDTYISAAAAAAARAGVDDVDPACVAESGY